MLCVFINYHKRFAQLEHADADMIIKEAFMHEWIIYSNDVEKEYTWCARKNSAIYKCTAHKIIIIIAFGRVKNGSACLDEN